LAAGSQFSRSASGGVIVRGGGEYVENDASGMNVVRQRFGAGGLHSFQTVGQNGSEDIDHPLAGKRLQSNLPIGARASTE
tara:strand:+ start:147 stop:386 length:240 start_codon:yes stop_codon:yes gene_type:complete